MNELHFHVSIYFNIHDSIVFGFLHNACHDLFGFHVHAKSTSNCSSPITTCCYYFMGSNICIIFIMFMCIEANLKSISFEVFKNTL